MLHERPVPCDPPIGGGGTGDGDVEGAWTGQKRHKYEDPSLRSPSDAHSETIGQDNEERPDEIVDSPDELPYLESDTINDEEFLGYLKVLSTRPSPMTIAPRSLDNEEQRKLYERLYRIRASELAQGVCTDDPNVVTLSKEYSPYNLKVLLDDYEKAEAVDWYFDHAYSSLADLEDYHRLVLKDDGIRYFDWATYRSSFTSYEIDEEYVNLCAEISKKIKWIKRYMEYESASSEWIEMNNKGFRQAVRIAANFPRMSYFFTLMAFKEHVSDVMFDYWNREDIDRLFFEMWKFMTEQKVDSRAALVEVNRKDNFPRYRRKIQFALDHSDISDLFLKFDICVEDIPNDASLVYSGHATPERAFELISSAVWNKLDKPKMWHQYITRKMEIAKHIGLYPQARCVSKPKTGMDVDLCAF